MHAMMSQRAVRTPSGISAGNRRSVACSAAAPPKRVLITGGNAGLGYEAALSLARLNYDVTIAGRNDQSIAHAKSQLEQEVPGVEINTERLELADFSAVREFTDRLLEKEPFDVVINNAGAFIPDRTVTKDGFEYHFEVNYLSQYLLTSLLLPTLIDYQKPVRVINVASAVHMIGNIHFDDINYERNTYNAWEAYGQSKLAMVMWTYELAKRLKSTNVTVNVLHPGTCDSKLGREFVSYGLGKGLGNFVADTPALITPKEGATTIVHLASSPDLEGITGQYWATARPFPHPDAQSSSPLSYKTQVSEPLMRLTEQLTGEPLVSTRQPAKAKSTVYEKA